MNKKNHILCLAMVFTSLLACQVYADFSVGLGYPYLGAKYDFIPEISGEIKYAASDGIQVIAGRGYWNFYQTSRMNFYGGLEAGYVGFNAEGLSGSGLEYGLFVGTQYKIVPELGISLDFGPNMIDLNSNDLSSSGLEWVVTAGVYLYLF